MVAGQYKFITPNPEYIPPLDFNSINFLFDIYKTTNRAEVFEKIMILHNLRSSKDNQVLLLTSLTGEIEQIENELKGNTNNG